MTSLIRVGCSGWQYRHWRGRFYPRELPTDAWLEHYATTFDTVELNNSFYRLPEADTFAEWARRVPDRLRLRRQGEPISHAPAKAPARATGAARAAMESGPARLGSRFWVPCSTSCRRTGVPTPSGCSTRSSRRCRAAGARRSRSVTGAVWRAGLSAAAGGCRGRAVSARHAGLDARTPSQSGHSCTCGSTAPER